MRKLGAMVVPVRWWKRDSPLKSGAGWTTSQEQTFILVGFPLELSIVAHGSIASIFSF